MMGLLSLETPSCQEQGVLFYNDSRVPNLKLRILLLPGFTKVNLHSTLCGHELGKMSKNFEELLKHSHMVHQSDYQGGV